MFWYLLIPDKHAHSGDKLCEGQELVGMLVFVPGSEYLPFPLVLTLDLFFYLSL